MINSENNMVNQQIMQNPMMQMGQLGQIKGMNNNMPMIGQLGNYMMNNMQQMNNQNINRGMVGMNPMINQMNSRMENGPMTNNNLGMMGNQKAQSHNEKSSNSQDSDSQFKSSPIPKNNMQSNKPECEIIFRVVNSPPYKLKCTYDDKVSDIIEKYRNKSGDKEKRLFIFNAKYLNPDLTVVEAGITHNSDIYVISGIALVFKQILSKNSAIPPIKIQCHLSSKVSYIIEKYRNIANDRDNSKKFIFKDKILSPDLTVEEAGIKDEDIILVIKSNECSIF